MSRYRFEVARGDYSLYRSGGAFVSAPGHPGFPVRLASEIFQTCLSLRAEARERVVVFDPCCGAGYLLGSMAFRHRERIRFVVGSDLDEESLALARSNLSLLTMDGLVRRRDELVGAQAGEWRASRQAALDGVEELIEFHAGVGAREPLGYRLDLADAGSAGELAGVMGGTLVDVAVLDVPYGGLSSWDGCLKGLGFDAAISHVLASLRGVLGPAAVVAVVSPKKVSVAHPGYERRGRFKLGKRMVTYLSGC